jgi:hypothetical protein
MPNSISFARVDQRGTGSASTTAVTGVGTAQVGAAALTGAFNIVTTASGQTAVVLPANYPAYTPLIVRVTSATAGLVFPPTGGTINGGSANASLSVAQNKPCVLMCADDGLSWIGVIGA